MSMTPQQLKNSILQRAIEGKLVEQRPEEGTGEELYQKIQKEKQKLIKSGKLKKEKPLPEITENEIPFDIPETWKWVRHNELFTIVGGSQPAKSKFESHERKGYVRLYQIRDYGNNPVPVYVDQNAVSKFTENGDILLARYGGSLGKVFWARPGAYNVAMAKPVKLFQSQLVDVNYLFDFYLGPLYQNLVLGNSNTRSAQGGFNQNDLGKLLFPLPPLAEQKRIVAKIEELLPYVGQYEKAWTRLEKLNKRFPDDMKKSILQEAIQGKLVEQRPEEGTGEELYQKIQKEKQKLIKSGKLKKEKELPVIPDDEIPFDIPESWKWVRWGDLSQSIQYGYNAPAQQSGHIRMVRISDIQDGKVDWKSVPYCIIKESDIATYALQKNDILFARTGGTVGKSYIVNSIPVQSIYAGYLIRTRYSSLLCPSYMKYYMESSLYWTQLNKGTIATAQPNCNGKTLSKLILPLPPLAEQKRIVTKIDELLSLCERMR